jgi:uncharacterized protein Usg
LAKISNFGRDFQLWPRFPTLAEISNFGQDFQQWPRFLTLAEISKFGQDFQLLVKPQSMLALLRALKPLQLIVTFPQKREMKFQITYRHSYPTVAKISNFGQDFQLWPRFPTLAKVSNYGRDFQQWPRFPSLAEISNNGLDFQLWPRFPTLAKISKYGQEEHVGQVGLPSSFALSCLIFEESQG